MKSKITGDIYDSDSSIEEENDNNQNKHPENTEIIFDLTKDIIDLDVIDINQLDYNNERTNNINSIIEKIKNNISYKDICDFRLALKTLNSNDVHYLKEKLIDVLFHLIKFVEDNKEKNNFYTIFQSSKQLFLSILNNENKLLEVLKAKPEFITNHINYLDGIMKKIIEKQVKMKKSRKNLKSKLRLQRKLNEARDMVLELAKNCEKNEN
jgi:hypothetical protein